MSVNRPDRPLRSKGAKDRDRDHDHPDRKADLRERSDGAHAEYVTPPEAEPGQMSPHDDDESASSPTSPDIPRHHEAPPESPAGPQSPGPADGPATPPSSATADADPGPTGKGPKIGASGIAILIILAIPALIYLAMIAEVFTVGG